MRNNSSHITYKSLLIMAFLLASVTVFAVTPNEDVEDVDDVNAIINSVETNEAKDSDKIRVGAVKTAITPEDLAEFGFGPAFFIISYDDKVLQDSKSASVRGDGAISSSGSKYSTAIGLEVHYGFSFGNKLKCFNTEIVCKVNIKENYSASSGHTISPFLGVYDLNNGINGIVAGIMYGFWRGDGDFKNRSALNFGLGWTVHKNQLVLANGVNEGRTPPAGLITADYTERKDVTGLTLMVSGSIGF
jgi:hypothetical protein